MKIKELTIFSSQLELLREFYSKTLELKTIKTEPNSISFQIGSSILTIKNSIKSTPYHFAINIPSNKEKEALKWLKQRVEVLKDGGNEIQDFDFWNAKAVYFYDKDNNIVELISRKNLENPSSKEFNSSQFLEISEIGLPTVDIEKEFQVINNITGMEIFSGGYEQFCAIGDEHGLFICIDKSKKTWFPTDDQAFSSDFLIDLSVKNRNFQLIYKNEVLRVF